MISQDRLNRLAQQVGERLQDFSQAPEEAQKGVQQVVRSAFDRLELVSREDFDILMDVLQRTRSRVEALEKQVVALEAVLEAQSGAATGTAAPEPIAVGTEAKHEADAKKAPTQPQE
ncbi:MAG: accessory factor UbiK family protein [Halomonas sp.]|uniref:accessory factor UbiK family protein n=1 Tax=Halomonas sp. TaxID=1486246 RepID=UPI003F8E6A55